MLRAKMRVFRLFSTFFGPLLLASGCGGVDPAATTGEASLDLSTGTPSTGTSTSTTTGPGDTAPTTSTSTTTTTSESSGVGPTTADTEATKFDLGAGETQGETEGGCPIAPNDASITGTVYAPNQVIPVSGALVYATDTQPEGIPDEVYCTECVQLACETQFALTKPDGSFDLAVPSGSKYVVVQKGQFMRVTELQLAAGVNALPVEVTSLPDHRDAANGLYIPNIALGLGSYDRLEDALGKLGLADTLIDPGSYSETLVEGTQQFDMWDNGGDGLYTTVGSVGELVLDYAKLSKYHVLFMPCSSDPYLSDFLSDLGKENLRKWVAAGGKFYVSDWSNEYLSAAFDQYQTFYQDMDFGGPDLYSPYDSLGTVLDPDLVAWLEALPPALKDINPLNGGFGHPVISALPQIETVDNWSGVAATPPVLVDDGMGGQIDVGHKTWIEGPGDGYNVPSNSPNPMTITGHYGCGKIMFTSYHMAEASDSYIGLTPQELVLLYLILEIGVCQEAFEPPPPPR